MDVQHAMGFCWPRLQEEASKVLIALKFWFKTFIASTLQTEVIARLKYILQLVLNFQKAFQCGTY